MELTQANRELQENVQRLEDKLSQVGKMTFSLAIISSDMTFGLLDLQ